LRTARYRAILKVDFVCTACFGCNSADLDQELQENYLDFVYS